MQIPSTRKSARRTEERPEAYHFQRIVYGGAARHKKSRGRIRLWKILAETGGKAAILGIAMTPSQESQSPSVTSDSGAAPQALIARFAHDLRSPLSSILTGTEVMKMSGGNPKQAEKVSGLTERQTHEISRLVEELSETLRPSAD